MKGSEFISRALKLAKHQGIVARVDKKRGKGSHVTLDYGNNRTVVRNPKDELTAGAGTRSEKKRPCPNSLTR